MKTVQLKSEEVKAKSKHKRDITECRFPHDTIPESTDRGIVGVIQKEDNSKTKEQRERAKKKCTKKILRARARKALIPPYWCGGIPRTIRSLSNAAASGILKKGDIFDERDSGELVIREYHEFMDRTVQFKKYPDKMRSMCPSDKCVHRCTIRYGYYDKKDSEKPVWSVRTFFPHSCPPGRSDKQACNYPSKLLAMILMYSQEGAKELTQNETSIILKMYLRHQHT